MRNFWYPPSTWKPGVRYTWELSWRWSIWVPPKGGKAATVTCMNYYNIYTWFVGLKHSHWLMVVHTILLWQITECSLVGRWSFSVMISELWRCAWVWLWQQLLVSNPSWLDAIWVGWLSTCWKWSRRIGSMRSGRAGSQLARYDLDGLTLWLLDTILKGWLLNVWSQSRRACSLLAAYNLVRFSWLHMIWTWSGRAGSRISGDDRDRWTG